MKPGGLCSPSDGSSTPSGDGIGSVSSCKSIAGGSQYPNASNSSENPQCLTPDHLEDRHLGNKANRSIANGFVPDGLANGACEDGPYTGGKGIDVSRHVLSPPCSEDGEEGSPASHAISPGSVARNPSTSTLYQGRSDVSLSKANILDFGNAAESLPEVHPVPIEKPLPGTSEQMNSVYNVFSNLGAAYVADSRMECPKTETSSVPQNRKSPKYRRKCSLEEMVAKLHNRTEPSSNCVNVLESFTALKVVAERVIDKTSCGVQGTKDDGEHSSHQMEYIQSILCDKLNTANSDTHPDVESSHQKDVCHGNDSDEPANTSDGSLECVSRLHDCSNKDIESVESLCENVILPKHSVKENDLGACDSILTTAEKVVSFKNSEDIAPDDKRTLQSCSTEDNLCNEDIAVTVCKDAQNNSVLIEPLISNADDVSVDKDAKQKSPCSPSPISSACCGVEDVSEKLSVRVDAHEKQMKTIVDLSVDLESIGSSSVDIIDNETQDSGSDLEILYEKRKDASFCCGLGTSKLVQCSDKNSTTDITSDRSAINVLPSIVNCGNGSVQYLEPISDEENSLLCAPSPPSDFSLVSGTQSNSNTPLFSDTPSDTSRGAIMVKISDAVAAILSDVSDESLPPSPEAGDTGLPNTFSNILPALKSDTYSCKRFPEDNKTCINSKAVEKCVSNTSDEKDSKLVNVGASEDAVQSDFGHCNEKFVENDTDVSSSLSPVTSTREPCFESPKKIAVQPCHKETYESALIDSTKTNLKECESKSVNMYLGDGHSQSATESQVDSLLPASKRILHYPGFHMQNMASIVNSDSSSSTPLCQNSTSGTLNVSSQNIQKERDNSGLDCYNASRLEPGRQGVELDRKDVGSEGRLSPASVRDCISEEPSDRMSEPKDCAATCTDRTIVNISVITAKEKITSASDSVTTLLECSNGVEIVSSNKSDLLPSDAKESCTRETCLASDRGDVAEGSVSKDLVQSCTSSQATQLVDGLVDISDSDYSNSENQKNAANNLKNAPVISDGFSSECTNLVSTCIIDKNTSNIPKVSLRADAISETNLVSSKQIKPVEALFSDSSSSSDEVGIEYDISCLASIESEPRSVEVLQNSADSSHSFSHAADYTGLLLTNPKNSSDLTRSEVLGNECSSSSNDNLDSQRYAEIVSVMADDKKNASGNNCGQISYTTESDEHTLTEVLCGNSNVFLKGAKKDQEDYSDIPSQIVLTREVEKSSPNSTIVNTPVNPCFEPRGQSISEDSLSSSLLREEALPVLSKDKVETDQQVNLSSEKSLPQDVIDVNTIEPSPVVDSKRASSVTKEASECSRQIETSIKHQSTSSASPKTSRIQLQRNNILQSSVYGENARTVSESTLKNVIDRSSRHHGKHELPNVERSGCAVTSTIVTKTDQLPTIKVNRNFEKTEADRNVTTDIQCLNVSDCDEKKQVVQTSCKDSSEENPESSQISPSAMSQDIVTSVEDVDFDARLTSGTEAECCLSDSIVMQAGLAAESRKRRITLDKDAISQSMLEKCELPGIGNIIESLDSENSIKQLPSCGTSQPSNMDLISYDTELKQKNYPVDENYQEPNIHTTVETSPSNVEDSERGLSPKLIDFESGKTPLMENGENDQSQITGTTYKFKEDNDQLVSTAAVSISECGHINVCIDQSSNHLRNEAILPPETVAEYKTCSEEICDKIEPLPLENTENFNSLVTNTKKNWYVDTSNHISPLSCASESDSSKKFVSNVIDDESGNSKSFSANIVSINVIPNQMIETAAVDTLERNVTASTDNIEQQFRHDLDSSCCQLDKDKKMSKVKHSLHTDAQITVPQHSSDDGQPPNKEICSLQQETDSSRVTSLEVNCESFTNTSHASQLADLKSTGCNQQVVINSMQETFDSKVLTKEEHDFQRKDVLAAAVTGKCGKLDLSDSDRCIGDLSALNIANTSLNVEKKSTESHQQCSQPQLGDSLVNPRSSMDLEECKVDSEILLTSCESIMQHDRIDVNSGSVVSNDKVQLHVNADIFPRPSSVERNIEIQLPTEAVDHFSPPTGGTAAEILPVSSNYFINHASEVNFANIPNVEIDGKWQDVSAQSSEELNSSANDFIAESSSLGTDGAGLTSQTPIDSEAVDHPPNGATLDRSPSPAKEHFNTEDSSSTITNDLVDQLPEFSSTNVISHDVPVANIENNRQVTRNSETSFDVENQSSNVYDSSRVEMYDTNQTAAKDNNNCSIPVEFPQQSQMNILKEDHLSESIATLNNSNSKTFTSTSDASTDCSHIDNVYIESESCPVTCSENLDLSMKFTSQDDFSSHEDVFQNNEELKVTSLEDVDPKTASQDHEDQSKDSLGSSMLVASSGNDACLLSTPSSESGYPTATPRLTSPFCEAQVIYEEKCFSGKELPLQPRCSIQDESFVASEPLVGNLSTSGFGSQESTVTCLPKSDTSGPDGFNSEDKCDHVLDPDESSSLPSDIQQEGAATEDHFSKSERLPDVFSGPLRLAEQNDDKPCDLLQPVVIAQNLPPLLLTEENQLSSESILNKISKELEEADSLFPYKYEKNTTGLTTISTEEVDGMEDVRKTGEYVSSSESHAQGHPAENVSAQESNKPSNTMLSGDENHSELLKVGEVKIELCSPIEETSSLLEEIGSDMNRGSPNIISNVFNSKQTPFTSEETVGRADPDIQIIGLPCPLCREIHAVSLQEHIMKHHTCISFIPAKATSAYCSHMLQRVNDTTDVSSMPHEQMHAYVCRSCEFSSKDINAVRFHLNFHEDVFQVNIGLAMCGCNTQIFSYQFHRWKSLIHGSPHYCYQCNHYYACERSLINHLIALHYPQNKCMLCNITISDDNVIYHTNLHRNDSNAAEDESMLSDAPITTRSKGSYGVAWNIHDNYLNYLDGKYFRLGVSSKVPDSTRDRSYLNLPIKNVLEEVSVPDKVKLDPGKDIRKYLQGKKDIKVNDEEINGVLRNFNFLVQMDLEKKCNQKKSKASGHSNKTKHAGELFECLGILPLKSKGAYKKDGANKNKGKSSKKRVNPDAAVIDDGTGESSKLTRTRSGMQPSRDDIENDEKIEINEIPAEAKEVCVSGEWSKDHTYVCCSCGNGYLDLADIMDHKWEHHPSVWCAHTMFQGQDSVPLSFCKQFQPPANRPHKLPLPALPPQHPQAETESKKGDSKVSESTQQVCSRCSSSFEEMESFHSHLVECGGLNQMVIVKKKNKKGFRFKRRKGQGVPSNRYGIGSLPSTPLKAKFGDRSSGLNTPPMDKSSSSAIHSSGVKRRLELAVGSINNDELKNRLKAIISKSKSASFNTLGLPSRRTIRMKLRKKALDTKWLRKTRHSDKVKEDLSKVQKSDEKKVGGSKEEMKGNADFTKDKKVKDTSEPQSDIDGKSKLLKNTGKLSGNKKGRSVSESENKVGNSNLTTSSVVNAASPSKVSKKKSKAQNPQFSKKPQAGKVINGVVSKQKTTKEITKSVEPALAEGKAIDVKKVLAKKILSKKNQNLSDVSVDPQIVKSSVIESDSTVGTDEISVQKKVKKTGKSKSSTTLLKAKDINTESTYNEKTNSKKAKNINLLQSKSKILKSKPASNIKATKKPTKALTVRKITEAVKNSFSKTKQDGRIPSKKKEPLIEVQKGVDGLASDRAKPLTKLPLTKVEMATKGSSTIVKRRRYSLSSSSEESEDSEEDSEPEVIRNFRSGRGCTGRMGLRNKKRLVHSRYSFRTCIKPTKKEVEAEENEDVNNRESVGNKSRISYEENDFGPDKGDTSDDVPLSQRRKRKIASFENYDDCAYIPNETSSYSEGDDSSLENYPIAKLKRMSFKKKRKVLKKKSQMISQEESLQNTKEHAAENSALQCEGIVTNYKVTSGGQIHPKKVQKKIRALHEAGFKKLKKKYVKARKAKNALHAHAEGKSDNLTLEASVENSIEIPSSIENKLKSKVKKPTVQDRSPQEIEHTSGGVTNETLQKTSKKKRVEGVGRRKSKGKKLKSNVAQLSDVHEYVPLSQDVVRKSTKKPASKKIMTKSVDLADALKDQNIIPGKIKSRSSSITLGSLDRVQEANKAVKKSSSMSDIPQGIKQDTAVKPSKSTDLGSNITNSSKLHSVDLQHEEGKLILLDIEPNRKYNQRRKSIGKRSKLDEYSKAFDISSIAETLTEDAVPPSSLSEPFNENMALATTKNDDGKKVRRKTRISSASEDVLQSGTDLDHGNKSPDLVRNPQRVNILADVVTFSEEENSAVEGSGMKIQKSRRKMTSKTVGAQGRKPVLQRHFGRADKKIQRSKNLSDVVSYNMEYMAELGEDYLAAEIETSNADEESDVSFGMVEISQDRKKLRKRKLKVDSFLPTCTEGNNGQSIEVSDDVPLKKPKSSLNPIGKVKKSASMPKLSKVFKGAENVDCVESIINNHIEKKKISREMIGNVKSNTEKNVSEIKTGHSKTTLKNKENDSAFDSMPVLEPMNVINPSLNCQSNHNVWNNDLTTSDVPSKIKRRRSSVEKIKDIPTRSSANQILPDCPSPPELHAFSDEHQLFKQGLLTPSEETALHMLPTKKSSKKSGSRIRQTQLSLEATLKEDSKADPNIATRKPYERKKASSGPGLAKKKKLVNDQSLASKTAASHNDKKSVTKPKRVGQKKKLNNDDSNEIKCLDCGLRFDSFASLEDHQQDCITIALEMSLMEAEDHLYECQHCHLTFALKGTHRQHTASCRLGKYKRPVHKNDAKVRRRTSVRATHSQGADISAAESDLKLTSSVHNDVHEQDIIDWNAEAATLSSPANSELKPSPEIVFPVAGGSKTDHIQDQIPSNLKSSSKLRKRSRTNGKVDASVGAEEISSIATDEKCVVCGCEIKDKDMSNMHLLLEQFSHSCKEQAVLEVCVLIAYYNLAMDTIKSMVTSAIFYQGSTILKLDAKLQTFPDFDPIFSCVENKTACQLMQILASPHCMWVSPVLEAQAKHYYTVEAVSISGSRQEALKAVTALEELFKEISSVDNSVRKNQMLRTMKETFEAGTL